MAEVFLSPAVLEEIEHLPGHVRQRARRAVLELRSDPSPAGSKQLKTYVGPNLAVRRIRIDKWRILYVVDRVNDQILVIGVRQRPPYQYEDLESLLRDLN